MQSLSLIIWLQDIQRSHDIKMACPHLRDTPGVLICSGFVLVLKEIVVEIVVEIILEVL
jgi:hypothetical protein